MKKCENNRIALVKRNTNETKIEVKINLDGKGENSINTGLPFFDHMIEQLSKHSLIDVDLQCMGDIEIDSHHTIEDIYNAYNNFDFSDEAVFSCIGTSGSSATVFKSPVLEERRSITMDAKSLPPDVDPEAFINAIKNFMDNMQSN